MRSVRSIVDVIRRYVRHVLPEAMFAPPPVDHKTHRESREAASRARAAVNLWYARERMGIALRRERAFWEAAQHNDP